MFQRILKQPRKSFWLLGPRGTGKSTWLKSQKFDLVIDLLLSRTRLELERDPQSLHARVSALPRGSWVLIDEIQKIPTLLEEVHYLYETRGLHFALSGSSARKLKRARANLLAGRAINFRMYPLVKAEYGDSLSLENRIAWGTLPLLVDNFEDKENTLESYIDNYLRQELTEEGILRKTEPFSRFLHVAALMNAQVLNVENIARECKVNRTTVDKYFDVLVDTLIGFKLPAYQPRLKIKETGHSKFYFFDSGVARAAGGLTRDKLDRLQLGFYFETFVLNEIRAYNDYLRRHRNLFYYGISGLEDIDLIVQVESKTSSRKDRIIVIEIKMNSEWKSKWTQRLEKFITLRGPENIERVIGIYTGSQRLKLGRVEVFPVDDFLDILFQGKVF